MNEQIIEWLTSESNINNDFEREMNKALLGLYRMGLVEAEMVNGQPTFTLSSELAQNPLDNPIAAAMTMYGPFFQAAEA